MANRNLNNVFRDLWNAAHPRDYGPGVATRGVYWSYFPFENEPNGLGLPIVDNDVHFIVGWPNAALRAVARTRACVPEFTSLVRAMLNSGQQENMNVYIRRIGETYVFGLFWEVPERQSALVTAAHDDFLEEHPDLAYFHTVG